MGYGDMSKLIHIFLLIGLDNLNLLLQNQIKFKSGLILFKKHILNLIILIKIISIQNLNWMI